MVSDLENFLFSLQSETQMTRDTAFRGTSWQLPTVTVLLAHTKDV